MKSAFVTIAARTPFAGGLRRFTIVCAFFAAGSSQAAPQIPSHGKLPKPASYLQAASDKEDAFAAERQKYLCVFKHTKFSTRTVRLYESFYIHGHEIRRLLAVNGVPLSMEQKRVEEARVEAEMAADQNKPVVPFVGLAGGMYVSPGEHRWAQTVEGAIVRAGTFSHERRVIYRGRPAIQVDFTGNRKFKAQTDEERIAQGMFGTVIVDDASGAVVRVAAEAPENVYHDGRLLIWREEHIGFDATQITENLYFPSSWVSCRSFPDDPKQIHSVDCEDYWLQSCRKYTSEARIVPEGTPEQ